MQAFSRMEDELIQSSEFLYRVSVIKYPRFRLKRNLQGRVLSSACTSTNQLLNGNWLPTCTYPAISAN